MNNLIKNLLAIGFIGAAAYLVYEYTGDIREERKEAKEAKKAQEKAAAEERARQERQFKFDKEAKIEANGYSEAVINASLKNKNLSKTEKADCYQILNGILANMYGAGCWNAFNELERLLKKYLSLVEDPDALKALIALEVDKKKKCEEQRSEQRAYDLEMKKLQNEKDIREKELKYEFESKKANAEMISGIAQAIKSDHNISIENVIKSKNGDEAKTE